MVKSNMRHAMNSRMPASAPIGTQATSGPSTRKAASASDPSMTPLRMVRPPLVTFTKVAPIVPAPGMPPATKETALATPCPISSRLELWRRRVSASSTTPVFSVSMESSADSVSAGPRMRCSVEKSKCVTEAMRIETAERNEPEALIGPMIAALPASCSSSGRTIPRAK